MTNLHSVLHRPGTLISVGGGAWTSDELATNTLGVTVTPTNGLFLPTFSPLDGPDGPAWWMPCSFATRLLHAGVQVALTAPGPFWLTEIPTTLTGREVFINDVAQLRERDNRIPAAGAFVKLAEAKDDDFQAGCGRGGGGVLAGHGGSSKR
ncbi:hypothetical protein SAMN05892883_2844 [Jatrophihabitans sp. GAS493]|uniref:hypothetical protein n=1 Tax=Jatrophihabitans sp. GAS493 TaxID=1907575 RepID=UPI000BB6BE59|nr:hypothetical protein [Jatrophihabitans sp. GAS493]SOD73550.1 hypothetical protein SAMN05892883_2844 [Jatrophihabitans sp. GAS493]